MRTGPNPTKRPSTARPSTAAPPRARKGKVRGSLRGQHTAEWWEHEVRKSDAVRCSTCGSLFLSGHWHQLGAPSKRAVGVPHATCPSCASEKSGSNRSAWAGELMVRGLAAHDHEPVLAAIHSFGTRARSRDPEERILTIDSSGSALVVRTTQNQMAVRLGKKLDGAFKGGNLAIHYSKDDLPIRVVWDAPDRRA